MTASAEDFSLPIGDGVNDTISIGTQESWYSEVSMNDNLETWQEVEKITGVKIEWQASADYNTVMQPRVAANEDLPDIFIVPPRGTNTGVYKLAQDGVIRQLDDLIAQYAPDIQKVLDSEPELKALLTAPDGNIYSICDVAMYQNDLIVTNALYIRQDWLDKLGLEQPETIEDWYHVLTAFKNEDPNGNGLQDEIPLSGMNLGTKLFPYFLSAYDLPVNVGAWWYDDNKEVFCTYATESFKAYLTEMNKWYAEGLIDMEMNRDEANFQALVATDVVGAWAHLAERDTQYSNLLETSGYADAEVALIHHPAGKEETVILKNSPTGSHWVIPTSSEKAELAIKWMNYVWATEDGIMHNYWGIEGKTWEVADGKKQFTDYVLENPDGLDPFNVLRSMGCVQSFMNRSGADFYEAINCKGNAVAYAKECTMIEPFPVPMLTAEEQSVLDIYENDFNTYCSENLVKFVTGARSLDEYDSFIEELNNFGIGELIKVKQANLDRS